MRGRLAVLLRLDRASAIDLVAATLVAAGVFLGRAVTIRVLLYDTPGCPPSYCVPVDPRLPVGALLSGMAFGLIALGAGRRERLLHGVLLGAGVGLGGALIFGLLEAARLPFTDPYFTIPYRVYALGAVFAAFAGMTALLVRSSALSAPAPRRTLSLALVAIALAAVLDAATRRELLHVLIAVTAVPAGIGIGRSWRSGWWNARRVLIAIVILTFASRAIFGIQTLARTGGGMAFALGSDDGDSYWTLASQLATDITAIDDVLGAIAFPPGYSFFLAALLAIGRGSLVPVICAQALLAAGAVWCVYRIAMAVVPTRVALGAAALFAFDQNLIQNSSTLTAEALLIPAVLLALLAAIEYRRSASTRWLVCAAAATAIAFVTRNVVAVPLGVSILLWLAATGRHRPVLVARDAAVFGLAVLIASAPIAIATAIRDGQPRLTTQLASLAWTFDGGPGVTMSNRELVERGIDPFADPAGSLRAVATDPGAVAAFYVRAVPKRLSTLLFFANPGYSDPLLIVNEVQFPNAFGETLRLLRLSAAVVAIIWALKVQVWRRRPWLGLLALYTGVYLFAWTFIFPPYHPFRYRIPIEPIRFIAESGGAFLIGGALLSSVAALHRRAEAPAPLSRRALVP